MFFFSRKRHKLALTLLFPVWLLAASGCDRGPPQRFFVVGKVKFSGDASWEIKDAYAWRQPAGNTTIVLLSDRNLPALPAQDTFAVVDLGLMHNWAGAPLSELKPRRARKSAQLHRPQSQRKWTISGMRIQQRRLLFRAGILESTRELG